MKNNPNLSYRLTLISHSIYGSYLRKSKTKPLSFYEILNKCLLLIQQKICIAIYKKDEIGFKYCNVEFINDKQHIENYRESICSLHYEDSSYLKDEYIKDAKTGKDIIYNIYSTGYFFHVFKIQSKTTKEKKHTFFKLLNIHNTTKNSHETDNYINNCFRFIFIDKKSLIEKSVKYVNFNKKSSDKFNNLIRNSLDELVNLNIHNAHLQVDGSRQDIIEESLYTKSNEIEIIDKYIDGVLEKKKGIFDSLYKKVADNVADLNVQIGVKENHNKTPNIIFFKRKYNRLKRRYRVNGTLGYNYDINPIIPISQQKDIITILKKKFLTISKSKRLTRSNFILINFFYSNAQHVFKSNLINIEKEFWNSAIGKFQDDNKEKFVFDWIFNSLKCEAPFDSQSLADSVMISGLIHFRSIYENGSLIKFEDEDILKNSKLDKNQRLKYFPIYASCLLLYAITPEHEGKTCSLNNLSIALYPIEISGRVSVVAGTVICNKDCNNSFNSYEQWNMTYYYYHYIILRLERLLRESAKKTYIKELCSIFESTIFGDIKEKIMSDQTDELRLIHHSVSKVNEKIKEYARFVPFDKVMFVLIELEENEEKDIEKKLYFLNLFEVSTKFSKNIFFLSKSNINESIFNPVHIQNELSLTLKRLELKIYDFINYKEEE